MKQKDLVLGLEERRQGSRGRVERCVATHMRGTGE